MTRLLAVLMSLSLAGVVAAQEQPKPATKAEEKKAEPKKDAPGSDLPPGEEIDVHKTAERIAENAQKAGDRLKEKDPGADTRKIQDEIIKDIDALIHKAQNPPPPPMSGDTSPMTPPPPKSDMPPPKGDSGGQPQKNGMGGGTQSKSPMGSGASGGQGDSGGKGDRRSRRERKPRGDSPMGMGDPMATGNRGGSDPMPATLDPKGGQPVTPSGDGGGDQFGQASPKRQNDKLADLYKDVWGTLPDRLRQEMDLYYREKFMPRYSELLRQYYAALAEQRKKGSEDR